MLSPHFIGSYVIISHFDKVDYELDLLVDLAAVHPLFHISLQKKCMVILHWLFP